VTAGERGFVFRSRWHIGVAVGAAAGIAAALVLATAGSARPVAVDFAQFAALQTGSPPWTNGVAELQDNLAPVHLDALGQEALAFHIHQHLDVYVNGRHITVPAGIGIGATFITEVHTHRPDGIIHVESPANRRYTLGQLFGEWDVRLTGNCLGRYCGRLASWVDGKLQGGNPAQLVLRPHQEIVIAAGEPPTHIPSGYAFPVGY